MNPLVIVFRHYGSPEVNCCAISQYILQSSRDARDVGSGDGAIASNFWNWLYKVPENFRCDCLALNTMLIITYIWSIVTAILAWDEMK